MIRYTLKCENEHRFESWFQSAAAFDTLLKQGLAECPSCHSTHVEKTLMAPTVRPARKTEQPKSTGPSEPSTMNHAMAAPSDPDVAEAVRKLRDHIEKNSEYVGDRFAREARSIHMGDSPERAIYGQANAEDVRKLAEDGIPALPLPFIPRQKTN